MGIIISVENYQSSDFGLNNVKYATNDSDAIKQLFIDKFGIDEKDIYIYKNEQFTKSVANNEVQYYLKQMSPDTELYIYYAGHGFFFEGKNYITLYDTSTLNLVDTSLSFEDLFLNTFRSIGAKSLVAFIDACAEGVPNNQRGINYRGVDFKTIPSDSCDAFRYALYFSCSPKEKSISDDNLEHGVWTYFLIKAFSDIEAYDTGNYISTASLQNYLMKKVGEFTNGLNKQTPYSVISSNQSWILFNSEPVASFDECVISLYKRFIDECNRINQRVKVDDEINTIALARDLCWQISDKLCQDWERIVTKLEFYYNEVESEKPISLSYAEQEKVLDEIEMLITSISKVSELPSIFDDILMPINKDFTEVFSVFMNEEQLSKIRVQNVHQYIEGIIDLLLKDKIVPLLRVGESFDTLSSEQLISYIQKYDEEISVKISKVFEIGENASRFKNKISDEELNQVIEIAIHIVEDVFVSYFSNPLHEFGKENIFTVFSMLPLKNRIYILTKLYNKKPNSSIVDRLSLAYFKNNDKKTALNLLFEAEEKGIINRYFSVQMQEKFETLEAFQKNHPNTLHSSNNLFDTRQIIEQEITVLSTKDMYPEFMKMFLYLMQTDNREYT